MIIAEPRTQSLNGTTQAGAELRRAVRGYVRAYASLLGRRKADKDLGVSRTPCGAPSNGATGGAQCTHLGCYRGADTGLVHI